jgi:hypothetical protein
VSWLNDKIKEQTSAAVSKFMHGSGFQTIVKEGIGQMPDNAIPKGRAVFARVMVERLISKHGWARRYAEDAALPMMTELEASCGPYGHKDYGWTARAAREWADEWSEDR